MFNGEMQKYFTINWTVENISYWWQGINMALASPKFTIPEIEMSTFQLSLYPRGIMVPFYDNYIGIYLTRLGGCGSVLLDVEFSFLSKDNEVLVSLKDERITFSAGSGRFINRESVFVHNRSSFLPDDKLTARCRIWLTDLSMDDSVQCFARTKICIESQISLWNIPNFSTILSEEKCTYQINSISDDERLIYIEFFFESSNIEESPIRIMVLSESNKIKYLVLNLTLLDAWKRAVKVIRGGFVCSDRKRHQIFNLPTTRELIMENKKLFLPDDVLSFRCDCTFSTGKVLEEIDRVIYGDDSVERKADKIESLPYSQRVLKEDLLSLFEGNILSDVKIKTNTTTFFAHKNILSARSPVFKAMFSNDMKENLTACVEIVDLAGATVHRMLEYVYACEYKVQQWEDACDLYRAADKYEILALREECSKYLKANFCPINICEALVFADTYQDEGLRKSSQDFIWEHGIMQSDEWGEFMKNHSELASTTMHQQIQKHLNTKMFPVVSGFNNNIPRIFPSTDNNTLSSFNVSSGFHDNGAGRNVLAPTSSGFDRNTVGTSTSFGIDRNRQEPNILPTCVISISDNPRFSGFDRNIARNATSSGFYRNNTESSASSGVNIYPAGSSTSSGFDRNTTEPSTSSGVYGYTEGPSTSSGFDRDTTEPSTSSGVYRYTAGNPISSGFDRINDGTSTSFEIDRNIERSNLFSISPISVADNPSFFGLDRNIARNSTSSGFNRNNTSFFTSSAIYRNTRESSTSSIFDRITADDPTPPGVWRNTPRTSGYSAINDIGNENSSSSGYDMSLEENSTSSGFDINIIDDSASSGFDINIEGSFPTSEFPATAELPEHRKRIILKTLRKISAKLSAHSRK